MGISDWSSDVCSSDLVLSALSGEIVERVSAAQRAQIGHHVISDRPIIEPFATVSRNCPQRLCKLAYGEAFALFRCAATFEVQATRVRVLGQLFFLDCPIDRNARSEERPVGKECVSYV